MTERPHRSPFIFIPTLYFAEGLPYVVVNTMSVALYKDLGVSNTLIGVTSLLYLPWVIKALWGPAVDACLTKRSWVVGMQALMAAALLVCGWIVTWEQFFWWSVAGLVLIALASATHDIAADGLYLLALDRRQQAFFVGIRSTFYRLATITGSGLLVIGAGYLIRGGTPPAVGWMIVLAGCGVFYALLALFHSAMLPRVDADKAVAPAPGRSSVAAVLEIFRAYFLQPGILPVLAFILLFRLGEGMLVKMVIPFLRDDPSKGGIGLDTQLVGLVYGTYGVGGLLLGGILGGLVLAKFDLRRCLWPMALCVNLPNLCYVYLAYTPSPPLPLTVTMVVAEQFGYGLGFTAFMVLLMRSVDERFKTSHFAISTGFMALGMMVPGLLSGWVQEHLGYRHFFIVVCLATIPGMLTIPFLPLERKAVSSAA